MLPDLLRALTVMLSLTLCPGAVEMKSETPQEVLRCWVIQWEVGGGSRSWEADGGNGSRAMMESQHLQMCSVGIEEGGEEE